MKRSLVTVCAAVLVLASAAAAGPPPVDADAVFVQDGATAEVLYAKRPRARLPIASITKLMTVLVALERARPTDVVTVSPAAIGVGGSTVHLRAGEQLTVRDLVEAALIQSANDAAYALAAHVGGGSVDRFVGLMNARARALGLRDTHFVRPDGLDVAGHVSTAHDVTLLARAAMRNPVVRDVVKRRVETIAGGRSLHTWNDLLGSFPGLVGVKTGHTSLAGWSQVAAVRGRGFSVYATLLGSPSRGERNADLAAVLAWAMSRYRATVLVSPARVYARAETGYGRAPVELVAARPLVRVVRIDRPLVERVVAKAVVDLPVRRGQRLGRVSVYAGSRLLGERPLVAARSASKPGMTDRAAWYAGRALRHIGGWIT